jgi:hypothetical protein
MSGDKGFLARWSRRKRDAAADRREQPKPADTGDATMAPDTAAASAAPPLVDPASLPSIESLGPESDLRAFLAAGVPADLARAALRRAWSTDPMIRNFIGLSENSWDFNAPGGVPGFGAVTAEDVRRLLAQAMGEPEATGPACPVTSATSTGQAIASTSESPPGTQGAAHEPSKDHEHLDAAPNDSTHGDEPRNIATQHRSPEREYVPTSPRRRHGSALPE